MNKADADEDEEKEEFTNGGDADGARERDGMRPIDGMRE